MTFSSSLGSSLSPLILDTSVLINLHASKHGTSILRAVPNEILVPSQVARELEHEKETSKENDEARFVEAILAEELVRLAELSDDEYQLFERLIAGCTTLGDGEAATIALASARGQIAVIDDGRGRSQALAVMNEKSLAWSLDLFLHPAVHETIGHNLVAEALHFALRHGRMRIHDSHCDRVVGMIGVENALGCTSLPNYKQRKHAWKRSVT
jgi:predicted nucleic acid-binding protein